MFLIYLAAFFLRSCHFYNVCVSILTSRALFFRKIYFENIASRRVPISPEIGAVKLSRNDISLRR